MNRRDFVKTLAVAGVSVALPINLVTSALRDHKFRRRIDRRDYDDDAMLLRVYVEVGGGFRNGGRRHATTTLMRDEKWRDMTSAQREATWRRLEKLTLDCAFGHARAA